MRCKFDPIVPDHVLQGIVAAQGGQAPLSGELFDVAADDVVHPVFLECPVLVPNHLELSVYLPQ